MDTQSPWNEPGPSPAVTPPAFDRPTGPDPAKLPMFCFVVAIIDMVMGGLTLLGAPMTVLGQVLLPDGSPLRDFMIPAILIALLVGGTAIAADTAMLKKKPMAVVLGYTNVVLTLIGVVFIWVQLPASIESQEMQLANDPNAANMPAGMQDMLTTIAVAGTVFSTLVRITLVILVLMAIKKFKAWLITQD